MQSTRKTLGLALLAIFTLSAPALAAPLTEFTASRADVRMFCEGEGYHLLDGGNFSLCTTPVTDVMCRDDGACASSNLELAMAAGFQRNNVAALNDELR